MPKQKIACPVKGCGYSGPIKSVAGHISGKRNTAHSWARLGYNGANHFKRVKNRKAKAQSGTQILHMTDTHLGKEKGGYSKPKWPVDCMNGFQRRIEAALSLDVDAVLHTGDLFHNDRHGIPKSLATECKSQLARLESMNIPFYYLLGDHERENGAKWLQQFGEDSLACHLDQSPTKVGRNIVLYGADYKRKDWWDRTRWEPDSPGEERMTILGLHQSLTPLSKADRTECDVQDILRRTKTNSKFQFDAIACGHLHKRLDRQIDGCRVVCSGSTERLGGSKMAFTPFVGLFEVHEGNRLTYQCHDL